MTKWTKFCPNFMLPLHRLFPKKLLMNSTNPEKPEFCSICRKSIVLTDKS